MPTNRKRTQRTRKEIMPFDQTVKDFLITGEKPEKDTPAWELYTSSFFTGEEGIIKETWQEYRKQLLDEWINDYPCTRPYMWWAYDAPKEQDTFESEAAYLKRHGLLTQSEKAYLKLNPQLLKYVE